MAAGSRNNGTGSKCFGCGQSGHMQANCPSRFVMWPVLVLHEGFTFQFCFVRNKGAGGSWKGAKQNQWNKKGGASKKW